MRIMSICEIMQGCYNRWKCWKCWKSWKKGLFFSFCWKNWKTISFLAHDMLENWIFPYFPVCLYLWNFHPIHSLLISEQSVWWYDSVIVWCIWLYELFSYPSILLYFRYITRNVFEFPNISAGINMGFLLLCWKIISF